MVYTIFDHTRMCHVHTTATVHYSRESIVRSVRTTRECVEHFSDVQMSLGMGNKISQARETNKDSGNTTLETFWVGGN